VLPWNPRWCALTLSSSGRGRREMGRLFGTDGVRGRANATLTPELALRLGRAAGIALAGESSHSAMIIGRDTRVSGDMLEAALAAGLCSSGVDVVSCGVCTTPAVAYLTRNGPFVAGIVISASHNPPPENGIKFFGHNGAKLPDATESMIETLVIGLQVSPDSHPRSERIGRYSFQPGLANSYADHCRNIASAGIAGMRIVVDGANGAGHRLNPGILESLGVIVTRIHCEGEGERINDGCGSTHPRSLQQALVEHRADLGAAFDGDGDRVILVDEKGRIVDGDHMLAIFGTHWADTDRLPGNVIVGTVMSNLGLEDCLRPRGVRLERASVGDRYVAELMRQTGAEVGGEKSGHIILSRHGATGDGLVTTLEIMEIMARTDRPLSDLAGTMTEYPQLLVAVRVSSREGWERNPDIAQAISRGERALEGTGRLLVRASGTESVIRVMAEGRDERLVRSVVEDIAGVVETALGGSV
jgi:phosphoglucosamine mutase